MADLKQARAFLDALASQDKTDDTFCFQTFDDNADRKDFKLAGVRMGTLDMHRRWLNKQQKKGAGAFVAINKVEGDKRSNDNVKDIRAAFVDADDCEIDWEALELAPSIVVQSKAGLHVYWLLKRGQPLERFWDVQSALAHTLGTDPKVKDLARVMRIPGYTHQKAEPFEVSLVHVDTSKTYTIDELFLGLALELPEHADKHKAYVPQGFSPKTVLYNTEIEDVSMERRIRRMEAYIEAIGPAIEGQGGNATMLDVLRAGHDFAVPDHISWPAILRWNESCVPPWEERELRYQYESLMRGNAVQKEPGWKLTDPNYTSKGFRDYTSVKIPDDVPWSESEAGVETVFVGQSETAVEPDPFDDTPWPKSPLSDDRRIVPLDEVVEELPDEPDRVVKPFDITPDEQNPEEAEAAVDPEKPEDSANGSVDIETIYDDRRFRRRKKLREGLLDLQKTGGMWEPTFDDSGTKRDPVALMTVVLNHYELMYDATGDWYIYSTNRWYRVEKESIEKLVSQYMTATDYDRKDLGEALHLIKFRRSVSFIKWNLIASYEIPLLDGVLNIQTMKMRKHRPGDLLDRIIPYSHQPSAKCELWLKCLEDWLPGMEQEKRALQMFMGYCLLSHARYKKALLLYGPPNTGKSQVCNIARVLVGGERYVCGILPSQMNDDRKRAQIKGKALNMIPDLPQSETIEDGGFKQMVSSGDSITIDEKYKKAEQYVPTAKHIFATNNLPSVRDASDGVFTRLMILGFEKVVPPEEQDPELEDKLIREMPGILNWAIEGARELIDRNGRWPQVDSSKNLIDEYKIDTNPIYSFIEESGFVEKCEDERAPISEITRLFNIYITSLGAKRTWTSRGVKMKLMSMGYKDGPRIRSKRTIKGIKIIDSNPQLKLIDGGAGD